MESLLMFISYRPSTPHLYLLLEPVWTISGKKYRRLQTVFVIQYRPKVWFVSKLWSLNYLLKVHFHFPK